MIKEILLAVSGFQNARVTPLETLKNEHGEYKLYQLDKWADDEWSDGVLIETPSGVITQIINPKSLYRLKELVEKGEDIFAMMNKRVSDELEKAKRGQCFMVPKHWAIAFDRLGEYEEAEKEFWQLTNEKKKKEAEEKKQIELAEQKAAEERLDKAELDYYNGSFIGGDDFEGLLKRHEIKVPLRTLGWIKNNLNAVRNGSYTFSSARASKGSTKMSSLMKELFEKLEVKHGEVEHEPI